MNRIMVWTTSGYQFPQLRRVGWDPGHTSLPPKYCDLKLGNVSPNQNSYFIYEITVFPVIIVIINKLMQLLLKTLN